MAFERKLDFEEVDFKSGFSRESVVDVEYEDEAYEVRWVVFVAEGCLDLTSSRAMCLSVRERDMEEVNCISAIAFVLVGSEVVMFVLGVVLLFESEEVIVGVGF